MIAHWLSVESAAKLGQTCRRFHAMMLDLLKEAEPSVVRAVCDRRREDGSYQVPMRYRLPMVLGLRKDRWSPTAFLGACSVGCFELAKERCPPPWRTDSRWIAFEGLKRLGYTQTNIGFFRWIVIEYNIPRVLAFCSPMAFFGVGGYNWTLNTPIDDHGWGFPPPSTMTTLRPAVRLGRVDILERLYADFGLDHRRLLYRDFIDLMVLVAQTEDVEAYKRIERWVPIDMDNPYNLYVCMQTDSKVIIEYMLSEGLMLDHYSLPPNVVGQILQNKAFNLLDACLDNTDRPTDLWRSVMYSGEPMYSMYSDTDLLRLGEWKARAERLLALNVG